MGAGKSCSNLLQVQDPGLSLLTMYCFVDLQPVLEDNTTGGRKLLDIGYCREKN